MIIDIVMVQNILRDHGEIYSVALILICNRIQSYQVGLQFIKCLPLVAILT